MCGIAGRFNYEQNEPISYAKLDALVHNLKHRGPDGIRTWKNEDGSVGLAHARLSVIDLEQGWQPITDEKTGFTICYNGELYNYREIREELLKKGIKFHTQSDTEVVLKAYVEWGAEALSKFNGIFAFAIFDPKKRSLFLARDPLGIKPLYYTEETKGLWFASELRALALILKQAPTLSSEGMSQYLKMGYCLAPTTILSEIKQLPQGSYAVVANAKMQSVRYYDPAKVTKKKVDLENLEEVLKASVKRQLVSDVPVGIALSGGIDSSLVASLAMETARAALPTFTLDFNTPGYSEVAQAAAIAKQLGTTNQAFLFDENAAKSWKEKAWASDAPIFDSSFSASYDLYQGMRKHVAVGLSGDGGDELFLGYETYRADAVKKTLDSFGKPIQKTLSGLSDYIPVKHGKVNLSYKLRAFFRSLDRSPAASHCGWRELAHSSTYAWLVRPDKMETFLAHSPEKEFDRILERAEGLDYFSQMSYLDCETWLTNDILVKADRSSMAHGLEVRVPLLDKEVLEFAFSLEDKKKFSFSSPKGSLREILRKRLPAYPEKSKKQGFGTPVSELIVGPLRAELSEMHFENSPLSAWIDLKSWQKLLEEHLQYKQDHGYLIWGLITLHSWFDRLVEERKPTATKVMPRSQSDAHLPLL